ncbi:MAG: hypothetical protein V3V14_13640, partial [Saprospiraceae bacterium]
MQNATLQQKTENKIKGIIISLMVHGLLLLIALMPQFTSQEEIREISGIVVSFGNPNDGNSNSNSLSDNELDTEEVNSEVEPSEKSSKSEQETAPQKQTTKENTSTKQKKKEVIIPVVNQSKIAIADAQKEKTKREAILEEKKKEEKAQKAADELAKKTSAKKAVDEAKKERYAQSKKQYSDLFGSGKGNNNNAGTQGEQSGDPDSNALNDLAQGSGRIGGGLANRNVLSEPKIKDKSQKTGKVVVK